MNAVVASVQLRVNIPFPRSVLTAPGHRLRYKQQSLTGDISEEAMTQLGLTKRVLLTHQQIFKKPTPPVST